MTKLENKTIVFVCRHGAAKGTGNVVFHILDVFPLIRMLANILSTCKLYFKIHNCL
jgi:hypothetical protein